MQILDLLEKLRVIYEKGGYGYLYKYINNDIYTPSFRKGLSYSEYTELHEGLNVERSDDSIDEVISILLEYWEGNIPKPLILKFLSKLFDKKPIIQGDVIKVNVPLLNGEHYKALSDLFEMKGIKAVDSKRSGSGITILVTTTK